MLLTTLLLALSAPQEAPRPTTAESGERLRVVWYADRAAEGEVVPLRAALAEAGLEADVLASGREGLGLMEQSERLQRDVLAADPHLVVMDFRAPEVEDLQTAGMLLHEFHKGVVFELHKADVHVVFLTPRPAEDMAMAEAATAMGVEMSVRWFGEPLASDRHGLVREMRMLHDTGKLSARPKRKPTLDRVPPLDLREGLLEEMPDGRLLSGAVPGEGDFRLAADLVLDKFDHSAASLQFDGNHFGFDGRDGLLFVEGPAFGGGPFFAPNPIEAGKPFRLVIVRVQGDVHFRIDGRLLAAVRLPGPLGLLAFRPHRGALSVRGAWLSGAALEGADLPREAGYSIPLLDLAKERARQTVVDREKGQYLGHPTAVLLDDDATLLTVYPKGHGKGAIVMKRSEDGGRTWSGRLAVPESWATSEEVPTLYRTEDAEGARRLVMFSGLSPIRMAVSEDEGTSWSELAPIGDYGGIVAMASCAQVGAPGRYLAWFHDDGRFIGETHRPAGGGSFHVYQVESVDGGLTWGAPRVIATHPVAHLCEPGFVRSPDGRRIALLLRENSRVFNSFAVFSEDGGTTWSEPAQLPAALTGDRHVARYAPDGRLVISFRDTTRDSPTQGDWVAWVGRWQDLVDGSEGQYRVRLMDNLHRWDCAYPALELLPDGSFVSIAYGHWTEGEQPWIAAVHFTLAELDALLPQPPGEDGGD